MWLEVEGESLKLKYNIIIISISNIDNFENLTMIAVTSKQSW